MIYMLFQMIFFSTSSTFCSMFLYATTVNLMLYNVGILKNYIQCLADLKCDYTLSEEFRKNHYLVGLLLQEVKMCMNEPKEIRRHAIHLLRNQIAKHSFDDRYASKVSTFVHLIFLYH